MPTIVPRFLHKRLRDALPGELLFCNLGVGVRADCILIEAMSSGDAVLGVLRCPGLIERPSYVQVAPDHRCVSVGLDWVLDVTVGPESVPLRLDMPVDASAVLVQDNDAILEFSDLNASRPYNAVTASIMGNGRIERTNFAVPFNRWHIWANAEERTRPGAEPTVFFDSQRGHI